MQVYADNAATTKMSKTAIAAMLPYFDEVYGNPSSLHSVGQAAKEASWTDLFHLRRQRGGQSGHSLRRPAGRAEGQKAHYFHGI